MAKRKIPPTPAGRNLLKALTDLEGHAFAWTRTACNTHYIDKAKRAYLSDDIEAGEAYVYAAEEALRCSEASLDGSIYVIISLLGDCEEKRLLEDAVSEAFTRRQILSGMSSNIRMFGRQKLRKEIIEWCDDYVASVNNTRLDEPVRQNIAEARNLMYGKVMASPPQTLEDAI